ncbi:MAG: heme exporter protein CcmD [Marinovum sp.]|nr:heme exporter protein CcmD [Marinovum sp.]
MNVDLGSYATYVLSAYGVSLALLVAICWASIVRSRRVKRNLAAVEARVMSRSAP